MFKTRLLSGIILVLIAVLSIAAGGPVLFAVLLGISLIGVFELYRAMGVHQKGFGPLEIAGYSGTVLYDSFMDKIREFFYHGDTVYSGADYVCLCVLLSQIQGRTDYGSSFRHGLCGSYAVLHL